MPRPRFSTQFRTYGEWLKAGDRTSKYAREIIKKHKIFPDRNLNFLNNLKMSDVFLDKKPKNALSAVEKLERSNAFKLTRLMRKNPKMGFSEAIKIANKLGKVGDMTEKTYRRHLGNTLFKDKGKWKVRKSDAIITNMRIYSGGKTPIIEIKGSRDRKFISGYLNDLGLISRHKMAPSQFEEKYKNAVVIDANGKEWKLSNNVREIINLQTDIEDHDLIYAEGD